MKLYGSCLPLALLLNCAVLVISKSYYSVIAPGYIKSNRKYTVTVSLHEADEPAVINVRVQGPFYFTDMDIHLQPYESKSVSFVLPKLASGDHKLIAEGISGIEFRNESRINAQIWAGPKIYIQTDKAVYKPGDVVQFRFVLLDEHTRPLNIEEPIRVEIFDNNNNRVKQFKDITLEKGIYKGKFELSQYPVLGIWQIKVILSGKYDFSGSKSINVKKYVLPKFSVYIETDDYFILDEGILKVKVYGKYTFDKYVEGNLTARLLVGREENLLHQKKQQIITTSDLEFNIDASTIDTNQVNGLLLSVEFSEKLTGLTRSAEKYIQIKSEHYNIKVDYDSIKFQYNKPYLVTAHVEHWNGTIPLDRKTPVIMKHGSKEYQAYLDDRGDATFEFDHERDADHVFRYKDSSYKLWNIHVMEQNNETLYYCKLLLKGDRPRLGVKLEIEVTSIDNIPYLNYIMVGHADIIKADHIVVPPNTKNYTIEITPSIEMVPTSFIYVYYVQNGQLRYEEMQLTFPMEFENKVSVHAPKKVRPGQNVTIELKAQPKSLVGLMAVDLAVFLLDPSYDLKRHQILADLNFDRTSIPFLALVYPGLLSGVVTLTNAHYLFVSKLPYQNLESVPRNYHIFLIHTAEGQVRPPHTATWDFRKKFPETWIFNNYVITNETTKLELTVPDTITTWRLTAFTVNDVTGFGIVDGPTDIISIQQFFIILNLPYSVKRGEIISIPVVLYNYHEQSVEAEVTMYNDDMDFYFIESSALTTNQSSEDQQRVKHVDVPVNGVAKVEFLINPKRVGNIKLKLTAENPLSKDAVIHELKVEPEGVEKRDSTSVYVRLPNQGSFDHTFAVNIPQDIVPDSEFITLTAGGDSLVPTLENLNGLVILPTGCGEQNMVNFAPNILVMEYLKASGNYFKQRTLVHKAKKFIEIGFQQQLSYRHNNGGYSVFGQKKDSEASTWLTAYVIRFFITVSPYLSIEPHIVSTGLDYLSQNQLASGDFAYTGYLFYPAQQNRFGFTAFVLMTFLENDKIATKYQSTIQKGLTFLNVNLEKIKDIYALSIVAVALQMAKHENAQKVIDKLQQHKRELDQQMWWSQDDKNREKDVEITAYVLMALLQNDNDPTQDLQILKWLVDQRNAQGGFRSTHDTVVGLQALVAFSKKYGNSKNMNMNIQYKTMSLDRQPLESGNLVVDATNSLILQSKALPASTRFVEIKITGLGYSLVQLSYQYNVATANHQKHFQIQPKPQLLNDDEMLLEVCFDYVQHIMTSATDVPSSNMIIMEANLPSGFTSSAEASNELLENEIIQRIETKNSEATIVIYFEKITPNEGHCLNILAAKIHEILNRKPAAISLYDYYNISRHDTVFYNVEN